MFTHREGLVQPELDGGRFECWGRVNLDLTVGGDAIGGGGIERAGNLKAWLELSQEDEFMLTYLSCEPVDT